ncbi:MAG TPA: hypothetical protein VJ124_04870 [Pyrinomonadaceae bacterium]|nr:hypothetical protein [Pyrinomonadaceae bacterium]
MIFTNKIFPVALIAALVGGSVGAFVMRSKDQPVTAAQTANNGVKTNTDAQDQTASDGLMPAEFGTAAEQTAYKNGFADGFRAAQETAANVPAASSRVVYSGARRSSAPRRVYYDYNRPQGRSFWQKHRDKLTLAMGTGAGAAVGGLAGGKKGAAIGALAGLGGSALYTYKLRNRNQRY